MVIRKCKRCKVIYAGLGVELCKRCSEEMDKIDKELGF